MSTPRGDEAIMSKKIEEETNRTVTEPVDIPNRSKDDEIEGEPKVDAQADSDVTSEALEEGLEYKETVELEAPGPDKQYKDRSQEDFEVMDDPRQAIAKKFEEKHRKFDENAEDEPESEESVVESEETADIIDLEAARIPEMVTIKVNGRELEVEKERVDKAGGVQAYQKEVAVSEGFKEIAAQKKHLEQKEAELLAREQRIQAQTLPVQGVSPQQPPADLPVQGDQSIEELAQQYHTALLDGDDEQRDKLFARITAANRVTEKPIDVAALINQATQNAVQIIEARNQDNLIRQAQDDLKTSHPELLTDELLFRSVDLESEIVARDNPHWSPGQILNKAYANVVDWKGEHKTDSMVEKETRKRAMNRPKASTGRASAPPPPPTRTDSDYVAELRKQRGLGE
jgi:hypothetical protein